MSFKRLILLFFGVFFWFSTGGDVPEAVADALNDLLSLTWRQTATKICVFISDAPPHGLSTSVRDGFPTGECIETLLVLVLSSSQKMLFRYLWNSCRLC